MAVAPGGFARTRSSARDPDHLLPQSAGRGAKSDGSRCGGVAIECSGRWPRCSVHGIRRRAGERAARTRSYSDRSSVEAGWSQAPEVKTSSSVRAAGCHRQAQSARTGPRGAAGAGAIPRRAETRVERQDDQVARDPLAVFKTGWTRAAFGSRTSSRSSARCAWKASLATVRT